MKEAEPEIVKENTRLENDYNLVAFDDPIYGVKIVSPFEKANVEWEILIRGIDGTPFEGGIYRILMQFKNFPAQDPIVVFRTKIWHP